VDKQDMGMSMNTYGCIHTLPNDRLRTNPTQTVWVHPSSIVTGIIIITVMR
jgi:hypothetical protein